MDFKRIIREAKDIKFAFDDLNRRRGEDVWQAREYADGLAGDVGDLIKLLVKYQKSESDDTLKKIRHEIADCLWSLILLSQELNVDLEKEILINLEYLKQKYLENAKNNNKK